MDLVSIEQALVSAGAEDGNTIWMVVDDADSCDPWLTDRLNGISAKNLHVVHLRTRMPQQFQHLRWLPAGVANRNAAFLWLRTHWDDADIDGTIYFADDDNVFHGQLLAELRRGVHAEDAVRVGPVGLVGEFGFSAPVVDKSGQVIGFHDAWPAGRWFPLDMAGFAMPLKMLLEAKGTWMPFYPGWEESKLLRSLGVRQEDLLPLAENASKVWAWHTKWEPVDISAVKTDLLKNPHFIGSNLDRLVNDLH